MLLPDGRGRVNTIVGFKRGTECSHGSIEARIDGLGRNPESLSNLLHGHVHEVPQHDDRAVVRGEMAKSPAELVAIDDDAGDITDSWFSCGRDLAVRQPFGRAPGFRMAAAKQDPVRPRSELGWIAQTSDVTPDIDERLLRDIFGHLSVSKDAVGDSKQSGVIGYDQCLERGRVALLCPADEPVIHVASSMPGPEPLWSYPIRASNRLGIRRSSSVSV